MTPEYTSTYNIKLQYNSIVKNNTIRISKQINYKGRTVNITDKLHPPQHCAAEPYCQVKGLKTSYPPEYDETFIIRKLASKQKDARVPYVHVHVCNKRVLYKFVGGVPLHKASLIAISEKRQMYRKHVSGSKYPLENH